MALSLQATDCGLAEEFAVRMDKFRQCLQQRSEEALAVVTHYGVLEAMTGHTFANCELWSCMWEDGHCVAEHGS